MQNDIVCDKWEKIMLDTIFYINECFCVLCTTGSPPKDNIDWYTKIIKFDLKKITSWIKKYFEIILVML